MQYTKDLNRVCEFLMRYAPGLEIKEHHGVIYLDDGKATITTSRQGYKLQTPDQERTFTDLASLSVGVNSLFRGYNG